MIDLIVAGLAVAALVAIVVIVWRKFPKLASINTEVIPAEKSNTLKAKLIEDRMRRRLTSVSQGVAKALKPLGGVAQSFAKTQYQKLLDLEKKYRNRMKPSAQLTPEEKAEKVTQVEQILAEAASLMNASNLSEAEQKVIEAVSIDPRNAAAYRLLATIYLEQKDYEHARETLMFLIDRLKIEDDELYAELGLVASGEGKFDEARQDLEKSIVINGQVAQHYLDLSRVQLALGDSLAAFESCRKTVELEPNNPKFLDALVDAAIVAGKRDWAAETLEKLRIVNPDNQKLTEFSSRIEAMAPSAVKKQKKS